MSKLKDAIMQIRIDSKRKKKILELSEARAMKMTPWIIEAIDAYIQQQTDISYF